MKTLLRMRASRSRLFSRVHLVRSTIWALIIGALFLLVVFGTYGTTGGGVRRVEGVGFLYIAYPAAVFFLALLFFTVLYRNRFFVNPFMKNNPEALWFLLFYALSVFSLLGAPEKILGTVTAMAGAMVTLLIVYNYAITRDRLIILMRFLCLFIWVTAVLAVLVGAYTLFIGSLSFGPIYIEEYNIALRRVASWFMTSTAFGVFLSYGVLASLYFIWVNQNIWARVGLLASLPLFIFGMGISGARTPFVILAIAFISLAISRLSLRKSYVLSLGAIFVVLVVLVYFLQLYAENIYIMRRILSDESDALQLGGRQDMFLRNLPLFLELPLFHILFGAGLGNFREAVNSPVGAHSGILRIMVEHGVLGIMVFFLLMSTMLGKLFLLVIKKKKPTPEQMILLMFIALFFSAEVVIQALMGISMDTFIFYAFIGLALAERRIRLLEKRSLFRTAHQNV